MPVAIRSMTRNSSIKSRNEDDATGSDGRAQSEDRTSKSSASAPYSTEGWESKKQQRKGRKGKGADRDTDNDQAGQPEKAAPATAEVAEQAPAKPELCEAPIPAVNVWERRKEAQAAAAKARVVPALPLANSSNGDVDGMRNGDDSPKSIESKKKSKAPEEADSPSASAAAGSKSLRRSTDSARPGSDQAAKSRPSRGNRVVEKDDKTASAAETPLPPVEDPSLWPTIRSVGEEASKKKTVEKSKEKEEPEGNVEQQPTATTKKSKRDWVTMPYVPSAVFQTPIPHRDPTRSSRGRGGGSAGRGGRESGGARAGTSIDKANVTGNGHAKPGAPDSGDRQRDNGVPSTMRTASLPPKPNRESGDSTAIRDQRKASAPASSDEPKRSPTDAQGVSIQLICKILSLEVTPLLMSQNRQSTSSRPMPAERQAGSGGRAPDNSGKEGGTQFGKDHAHPTRERTEGRSDRGRGGYRGRGGGHSGTNGQPHLPSGVYPQAVLPNFPGLGLSNGLPFRQQGPYSPPAQQGPFAGPPFIPQPPPARGNGRGGHRGNAAGQMFGRGSTNGMPMSVKVPVHNTMAPGMEYMTPMTPYGFAPAPLPVFDPTFLDTVVRQIDFYFSVDNLCRDLYLRKNMDSQGLVPLSLIAKFNRMVQLGADMDILRLAVERSENIEMLVGVDDGIERIRRREGWQEFVLPMDQRNPEAQNDGPRGTFRPTTMVQQQYEAQQMFANAAAYGMASPTFMNPNGPEMPYQQYTNGNGNTPAFQPGMGGGTAMNGHTGPSETPLSAAVPEFSPNPNGVESILRAATTFTDEQVDNLSVVVESSKSKGKKPAAPPPQMPIAVGTYHGNGPSSQGNGPPSQGLENGTDGPARSQPNGAHHDVPSAEGYGAPWQPGVAWHGPSY